MKSTNNKQNKQTKNEQNKKFNQNNPNKKTSIKSRISNITFTHNISHSQIQKILTKGKQLYKQKQWKFNFVNDVKKFYPQKIFQHSQVILIDVLNLHFCKKSTILKQICLINFPRLKYLILPGNQIKSWQLLGIMDLNSLQFLDLRQNYCALGKSLIKANLGNLQRGTQFPKICMDGLQNILRRSQFLNQIREMMIYFDRHDNIYPFIQSLIFKSQRWRQGQFRIWIRNCGIQDRAQRIIKQVLQRRTGLTFDYRWPLYIVETQYS